MQVKKEKLNYLITKRGGKEEQNKRDSIGKQQPHIRDVDASHPLIS